MAEDRPEAAPPPHAVPAGETAASLPGAAPLSLGRGPAAGSTGVGGAGPVPCRHGS